MKIEEIITDLLNHEITKREAVIMLKKNKTSIKNEIISCNKCKKNQ